MKRKYEKKMARMMGSNCFNNNFLLLLSICRMGSAKWKIFTAKKDFQEVLRLTPHLSELKSKQLVLVPIHLLQVISRLIKWPRYVDSIHLRFHGWSGSEPCLGPGYFVSKDCISENCMLWQGWGSTSTGDPSKSHYGWSGDLKNTFPNYKFA